MFVAGVVTKRKGFSSALISKKKINQHRNLHVDPQPAGFIAILLRDGCQKLYEQSEIHTYRVHICFKWRVEKDNLDLQ